MLDLTPKALTISVLNSTGRPGVVVVHINDEEKCVFRAYVPASEFRILHDATAQDKATA